MNDLQDESLYLDEITLLRSVTTLEELASPHDSPSVEASIEALARLRQRWVATRTRECDSSARERFAEEFIEQGRVLSELGSEFDTLSLEALSFAVEAARDSVPARLERAYVLLDLGRAQEALADVECALALAPDDIESLLTAIAVYAAIGFETMPTSLAPRVRSVLEERGISLDVLEGPESVE